jgi:hypothetical protein
MLPVGKWEHLKATKNNSTYSTLSRPQTPGGITQPFKTTNNISY